MSPLPFAEWMAVTQDRAECALGRFLPAGDSIPARLHQAMRYATLGGGKRVRPLLAFAAGQLTAASAERIEVAASAVELIHAYSLVHDDLPCMDDDDLRRGKPSNHKAFDEATAILAGDGLLTDAFMVMCRTPEAPDRVLEAVSTLALAAGSSGMVGGQEWDMIFTGKAEITLEELRGIHAMKTGALLRASCVCGAMLAGASDGDLAAIGSYGASLGVAFQIADDILDVVADTATLGKPAGSDVAQGKKTYPALLGLDASRALAQEQAETAKAALASFSGQEAEFLRALAEYTVNRAA